MQLGNFTALQTVDFVFNTFSPSGPETFLGSPSLAVYKGNSAAQSTAGITLTVDFDSVTGLNHVRILTSADPVFYAAGNDYNVVVAAGMVNGISMVGTRVGSFSIENRSVASVTGNILGSVASVVGNVGGNVVGSVGSVLGNVAGSVASVVGAVGSVAGNVAGNVVGSVGSVLGAVGSVTGNVNGNLVGSIGSLGATAKANVNAEMVDVITVDILPEPPAIPTAATTFANKVGLIAAFCRNKLTQTGSSGTGTQTLYQDDGVTPIGSAPVTDDGTTFTRGEFS